MAEIKQDKGNAANVVLNLINPKQKIFVPRVLGVPDGKLSLTNNLQKKLPFNCIFIH